MIRNKICITAAVVLMCVVFVGCGDKPQPQTNDTSQTEAETQPEVPETEDISISVETLGDQGKPKFSIVTNLPKKTVLTATLENDSGYSMTSEVELDKEGKGDTFKFYQDPDLPLAGEYKLLITMYPSKQRSKVTRKIGTKGETLAGSYVKIDEATGEKYLSFEMDYKSEYGVDELKGYVKETKLKDENALGEELGQIEDRLNKAVGGNYDLSQDESGINIDVWQDGMAANLILAQQGNKENKKAWKGCVKQIKKLSKNIQKLLNNHGFSDKASTVNLINDENHSLVLYTARSGKAVYDALKE